ncbi:MAG: copper resistance protein NlpE N-terminal domain-containing protein [Candidatus Baltobacteraceae bacterium]
MATALPLGVFMMDGTYVGTMPCSACTGVWTEITLEFSEGVNGGKGSGDFKMIERRIGSNAGQTVVSTGTWFVVSHRTDGYYQESGVIELLSRLDDGKLSSPRFFMCVLGQKLQAVGNEMRPVSNDGTQSLFRVCCPVAPLFNYELGPSGREIKPPVKAI